MYINKKYDRAKTFTLNIFRGQKRPGVHDHGRKNLYCSLWSLLDIYIYIYIYIYIIHIHEFTLKKTVVVHRGL